MVYRWYIYSQWDYNPFIAGGGTTLYGEWLDFYHMPRHTTNVRDYCAEALQTTCSWCVSWWRIFLTPSLSIYAISDDQTLKKWGPFTRQPPIFSAAAHRLQLIHWNPIKIQQWILSNPAKSIYSLVNVYITMENHHAIHGKIHYFYGDFP
jgi:hypothetical protein